MPHDHDHHTTQPAKLKPVATRLEHHKPLTALTVFTATTLVLSLVGLFLDPRATAILNTPAWAKTFKFSLSLVLYAPALIWAISLTTGRTRRVANIAGSAVGGILLFEMVLLVVQALEPDRCISITHLCST
ncbi:MAG: hypothetical protein HC933_18635 [Pleurocapsa sp. SU_196_0]|nr:hypothetical protein [Pleurocapsa sp. SU_196_0]